MRALVLLALVSCGGSTNPTPPADAPVGEPDAPDAVVDATTSIIDATPADVIFMCPDGFLTCNVSPVSCFPERCCNAATEQCCEVSFEKQDCRPNSEPCPYFCPRSYFHSCPVDELCVVNYAPGLRDPPPGVCEEFFDFYSCTATCPPENVCGMECCGFDATCVDGCCVRVGG